MMLRITHTPSIFKQAAPFSRRTAQQNTLNISVDQEKSEKNSKILEQL